MTDRPRFFDDLAGMAGGAFSALTGLRDEGIRKLDLVRREDMEAVEQMAANARAGQEAAETRLAALELRVAALEAVSVPPSDVERAEPDFPDPNGI